MLIGQTQKRNLLGTSKAVDITLEPNVINDNILLMGNISHGAQDLTYALINELLLEKQKIIVIVGYYDHISYWGHCIQQIKTNNKNPYNIQVIIEQNDLHITDFKDINYNADVIFIFPELNEIQLNDKNIQVDEQYQQKLQVIQNKCPNHVILFSQMPIEYIPEQINKSLVYSSSYKALHPDFQNKFKTKIYMNLSESDWIPGFCSELKIGEAYLLTDEKKKIKTHYLERDANMEVDDCLSFSLLSDLE